VGQIEVNLMNNPDKEVEDDLTEVYANASDNAALVKEVLDKFNMRVEKANKEFKPAPEEGEAEAYI
jgi:DNA topoisomerase IA